MSRTATTTDERKPRRHAILSLLLVAVSLLGLTAVTTGALFTATATASGNQFVTGSVAIGTTPVSAPLTMTGMAPGDAVTGTVQVSNTGTLAERYSVSVKTDDTASDVLAAQLVFTIKSGVTTCTTAGFAGPGSTQLYSGILGNNTGINVIGSPTQGQQAGDRVLAAGANETLCMQVSLPIGTVNAFQTKTANATMTFNAEQTANN